MSIASKLTKLETDITSAYNAVNTKGGTIPQNKNTENLSTAINSITTGITPTGTINITTNGTHDVTNYATANVSVSSGGGAVEKSDVNFYDYDGTLLASYTATAFANLTELPANPTHSGLTSQGWNRTLSDAKSYVNTYGALDIGQTYTVTDGKTRIYIHLEEGRLAPYLGFAVIGTATVNWGDNTTSTVTGVDDTTIITTQHTYSSAGDYVITLESQTTIYFLGNSSGICLLSNNANSADNNKVYANAVYKIECGNVSLKDYCFYRLGNLKTIIFSNTIDRIPSNAFQSCNNLKCIIMPNTITSMGGNAFHHCYGLKTVSLSNTLPILGNYVFSNCYSLERIVIPESTTMMLDYTFQGCYSLDELIMPNTLTRIGRNVFDNNNSLNKIKISNTLTTLGQYAFQYCYNLQSITMPSTSKTIPNYFFSNCSGLSKIKFLGSLTSIGTYVFSNCYNVAIYDFTACTSVPTLANVNAFSNIASDCKIVVPDSLYSTWTGASNWANYSSYIVKESEA